MAPEVYHQLSSDGFSSDVWSTGVVLYVMLTGAPLYTDPKDSAFQVTTQAQYNGSILVLFTFKIHWKTS